MDRYGMSVTDEPGSYRPPVRYVRTLHAAETSRHVTSSVTSSAFLYDKE